MVSSSLSMSSVAIMPKYVFGCNGSIPNSMHMIEEKKFIYIAGHNIVVHNLDDPLNQQFIPGSDWMDGINRIAVSPGEPVKFVAMCERGKRAQVTILEDLRKKRIIPDPHLSHEFVTAKQFLSCAFSPKNIAQHLITFSDDMRLIFWQWDTGKMLTHIDLTVTDSLANPLSFQCSIQSVLTDLVCVVTGTDMYKFMRTPDLSSFDVHHTQLRPPREGISTDYTCHVWTKDTMQLVVCTAKGDIMLVNHSGEFQLFIPGAPEGVCIDTILAYSHGFIVGGEGG